MEIIASIAPGFDIELLEADGDEDHLHLLVRGKLQTTVSRFVNSVKTVTLRRLKNEYPEIRKKLWKSKFWSGSYFVATTGGAPLDIVKAYIENQRT